MKSVSRSIRRVLFKKVLIYFLTFCLMFNTWLPAAMALEAINVVNSSGVAPVQWGDHTIINTGNGAIVNWNNFDTAAGQSVTFNQYDALGGALSSTSAVLNRIASGSATQFNGALTANGRVFIVNPAGVLFGSTATVNVTQLIASSLDITNENFLAGNYEFIAGDGIGKVVNGGTINASEGAALIGQRVLNAGSIFTGKNGFVVMAAGDRVLLGKPGSQILTEMDSVTLPNTENPEGLGYVGNENTGQITAPSGTVVLAAGDVFSTALDVRAEGGIGTVVQNGDINASGLDGDGGNVSLTSGDMTLLGSDSQTTVNAGVNGNGGRVAVYSPGGAIFENGARVEAAGGSESGDGGFFELSGRDYVKAAGDIDLTAASGKNGMFLIDPLDLRIVDSDAANGNVEQDSTDTWKPIDGASVSELDIDTLENHLRNANVTLSTWDTPDSEGQNGDVIFDADRYLHTDVGVDNSLFVKAKGNITFTENDGINFEGNGHVELYTGPEGSVTSVDRGKNPPNIWTRKGDIIVEAGRGGIDLGVLEAGTPSTSGPERPGEIRLRTVKDDPENVAEPGEYDITVQHLGVHGKGYGSVYVNSVGSLTINGDTNLGGAVQVKTVTPPDDEDARSFICLGAKKDVTISGDVLAEAQGTRESVASIWMGAGTHTEDGGYHGTVTVNGNIQADASAAESTKADATIRVYGSTVNLNGNKDPEALGQGSVTIKSDVTGYVDSEDAVYDEEDPDHPDPLADHLVSGSRAMVIIDNDKDSTCLECANIVRVVLPVAVDDKWIDSKNIAVTIEVLFNDKESANLAEGSLTGGIVYLDSFTSANGGKLTLVNGDTEVHYTPPEGWTDDFVDGAYTDSFYYYAVDSDGNVSDEPALVTITLTNQLPVANPDYYDVSHNVALDVSDAASGTIEGVLPANADYDPDPGDTLTAVLDGDGTTALGGSVVLNADGTFNYTPPADTVGEDSFTYYVTDGYGNSKPTTVTITLTNQLPVANPDYYDVSHNVALDVTDVASGTIDGVLPANADNDPDPGDTLTAVLDGDGTTVLGGSVVLNADGTFNYTPPADTVGKDSFTYYVTDGYGNSKPTTVTITLTNQLPFANPDYYDVNRNMALDVTDASSGTIEGLHQSSTDYDLDVGDTLTAFLDGDGTTTLGGSVILNTDGTFDYTPPADTVGEDSFTYHVTDGYGNSEPTTVTIALNNEQPTTEPGIDNINHAAVFEPPMAVAPGLEQVEFETSGCPALTTWAAKELGMDKNNLEISVTNSLASGTEIQPCDVYGRLRKAAVILKDNDGIRIAAIGQLINEIAASNTPLTEEMADSVAQAIMNSNKRSENLSLAREYMDALAKYVGILSTELGFSQSKVIELVMTNYVDRLVDNENVAVATLISARLNVLELVEHTNMDVVARHQ